MQPDANPISMDHGRQRGGARSTRAVDTISVTAATHSPANAGAPSGTSLNRSKQMGSTITAISISTVPDTVGVITRRSCGSHLATPKKKRAEATIRLASIAGPPSSRASTDNAI